MSGLCLSNWWRQSRHRSGSRPSPHLCDLGAGVGRGQGSRPVKDVDAMCTLPTVQVLGSGRGPEQRESGKLSTPPWVVPGAQ